ncbi:unnamed protein product, partial [Tetraodon nigroviridis]
EFVEETSEDYKAPTTSSFTTRMVECRNAVTALEEALDVDRSVLYKIKKSVKSMNASGLAHVENEELYIHNVEKFGQNLTGRDQVQVGSAFLQFSAFAKELMDLFRNLVRVEKMQNMNNIISFPLDSLLKGDLKGVKGDLKKPFEKSWKDYEAKLTKIEKEKREQARQYGMIRTEFSGGEIAEEMEKERRLFQLQMCEYLLKVNEINVKKGVDFLQSLIKYFHAQCNFFQDGLKAVETLKPSVEKLATELTSVSLEGRGQDGSGPRLRPSPPVFAADQTESRRREETAESAPGRPEGVSAVRGPGGERAGVCVPLVLSGSELPCGASCASGQDAPARANAGYSLHQLQGNKAHGTERSGLLYKRSEGLRKVWQKRKCSVKNGFLTICHGTGNRPPAKLNLLTCQVKRNPEEKKSFDLFSHDRTYHFQAEDEAECQLWVSVLQNSREEALARAFKDDQEDGVEQHRPGADPSHRGGGEEDERQPHAAATAELQVGPAAAGVAMATGARANARSPASPHLALHQPGRAHLHRVFGDPQGDGGPLLPDPEPGPGRAGIVRAAGRPGRTSSPPSTREKRFTRRLSPDAASRRQLLYEAVRKRDVLSLIQVYFEGLDLMDTCPQPNEHEPGETALHLAVRMGDRNSLHIVDFLAQNSANLDKQTERGSTALHYCCLMDNSECLKLLLRGRASVSITNEGGETPLDIARRLHHPQCEELVRNVAACLRRLRMPSPPLNGGLGVFQLAKAQTGKFNAHVHVEYEWCLQNQDLDESEDELEDKPILIRREERPISCLVPGAGSGRAAVAHDAAGPARDRQRSQIPSMMISNETYGTLLDLNQTPPLPPRDPSGVLPVGSPPPANTRTSMLAGKTRPSPQPHQLSHCLQSCQCLPKLHPSLHQFPVIRLAEHRDFQEPLGEEPTGSYWTCDWLRLPSEGTVFVSSGQGASVHRDHLPGLPVSTNPVPHLSRFLLQKQRPQRVKAIYNCSADHPDELTFSEGEVLVVDGEEDSDWWFGHVENEPSRRGVFPVTFVHFITD